jgi:hypothetical protein
MNDVQGYNEACKIEQKYLSQRAKALRSLEKYVEGSQYDGLPDWFSDEKPLWERAPCIVYPIVKSAIDSNSDLLLGESRFPIPSLEGSEGPEAEEFEKAVQRVSKQAKLEAGAREVFSNAQGCGSACAIFGVRGGRLFCETVLARWCTPELAPDGSVISLEIRYPYLTTVREAGVEKAICKLYRRVIDANTDVVYQPVLAKEDGTEPAWRVALSVPHGLGFCPVVWYPHMRGAAVVEDFDGRAIHECLTDEIRGHDFALSQRHRAALYAGDPQWTEIGVEPGYNPTSAGRKAEVAASLTGRPGERPHASYQSEPSGRKKTRKKSPGSVWQYGGDASKIKVELHCLPGDALKAIDDHASDLRDKIAESLGVVFLDMGNMPNESRMSGRGLEVFKARQLDRVGNYRNDFGDKFLIPAWGMLLRIAIVAGVEIDGLETVKKVSGSNKFWSWHNPPLSLMWGAYYKGSGEEEELIIRGTIEAFDAGLATERECAEKLRGIFNIKDIDAHMSEAKQAREQKQADALKVAQQTAALPQKPPVDKNVNA